MGCTAPGSDLDLSLPKRSGMWAPTHWEGHSWADEAASCPFCLPQKSVPQELFVVTKRLIGSTKGMKEAMLHSIPKTKNSWFWLSSR